MSVIKDYEKKCGKVVITDVYTVMEDGVLFKTADGRFVEGCVGDDNKHDGVMRVSQYDESWGKWLDLVLYKPSAKPEWSSKDRIEEAKKSIESPLFIADFQHGSFGKDPYSD